MKFHLHVVHYRTVEGYKTDYFYDTQQGIDAWNKLLDGTCGLMLVLGPNPWADYE